MSIWDTIKRDYGDGPLLILIPLGLLFFSWIVYG